MPSVSIILPVYNGEKYIENTIKSILSQSFDDFEIIVIDDGSVDRSKQIIEHIASRDVRIRLISQSNKGICEARNAGIKKTDSQYIMFCDHDDIFLPGYIEQAFLDISEGGYDFVKYGFKEIYIDGERVFREKKCILENKEYVPGHVTELLVAYSEYNEYIWDGIYKKEIIEKIGMFDTWFRAGCEDIDMILRLIENAQSCKTSSSVFYEHYIRNATSTSRKYNENTYEAVLKMFKKRMDIITGAEDEVQKYKSLKSNQFLWALLGMFSFYNCPLSKGQIINKFLKVNTIPGFNDNLTMSSMDFAKKIVIGLYRMGLYGILARICLMKRGFSK